MEIYYEVSTPDGPPDLFTNEEEARQMFNRLRDEDNEGEGGYSGPVTLRRVSYEILNEHFRE